MTLLSRSYDRTPSTMRPVSLERNVAPYAEGSCLVHFGETRVLCTASVESGVPGWRKGSGLGWLTAEYAMLPRATRTRSNRERSQVGGRTQEIQRLIGRSVRAMLRGFEFGEFTVKVDCDVLVADGGTRTAAITGACVAVTDAFAWMVQNDKMPASPVVHRVAAVSVGLVDGVPVVDLDYPEDVRAGVDMNIVMTDARDFVEVQGTGEQTTFNRGQLDQLLDLAASAITTLDRAQAEALAQDA
jgi:ribonuclease PH